MDQIHTCEQFIAYTKANAHIIDPNAEFEWNGSSYMCYLQFAARFGYEAFKYAFITFYDSIHPNAHFWSKRCPYFMKRLIFVNDLFNDDNSPALLLASHSRYNITDLIYDRVNYTIKGEHTLIEKIIAKANPNLFEPKK